MAFIMGMARETELVILSGFSSYQWMAEANGNVKTAVSAPVHQLQQA
jgi:hypothetical protein